LEPRSLVIDLFRSYRRALLHSFEPHCQTGDIVLTLSSYHTKFIAFGSYPEGTRLAPNWQPMPDSTWRQVLILRRSGADDACKRLKLSELRKVLGIKNLTSPEESRALARPNQAIDVFVAAGRCTAMPFM
jgi:hypothetical protein